MRSVSEFEQFSNPKSGINFEKTRRYRRKTAIFFYHLYCFLIFDLLLSFIKDLYIGGS